MSASRTAVSPRVRIRENDSIPNAFPAADTGLFAGELEPFNDKRTHIFSDNSATFGQTVVSYPSMLPVGHPDADVTGIAAIGRPRPGTADVHASLSAAHITPFTERDTDQDGSHLFASSSLGASFHAPLSSRIAIRIDITPTEDTHIYRCPAAEVAGDPAGEFFSLGEGTGFAYFNFASKKWDMIGKTDVATGLPAPKTDMTMCNPFLALRPGPKYELVITGNDRYMGQFVPPNHANQRSWEYFTSPMDAAADRLRFDYGQQIAMGSKKVGTPTTSFFAPFATKYHASKDHVLRMSDYIASPFLLERVRFTIPVQVRRSHGTIGAGNDDLSLRDMDNYVFFLYRQVRNASPYLLRASGSLIRDTDADVTGSDRFLIASASACFYNSPTIDALGATFVSASTDPTYSSDLFPFHSPDFRHDFEMNPTTVLPPSTFEGVLRLEMVPAISPKGKSGVSLHPFRNPNMGKAMCHLQHAWPGTAGSAIIGDNEFEAASGKTAGSFTIEAGSPLVYSGSSQSNLAPYYLSFQDLDSYAFKHPDAITVGESSDPLYEEIVNIYTHVSGSKLTDSINPDPRSFVGVFGCGESARVFYASGTLDNTPGTAVSYELVGNITPGQNFNLYGAASVNESGPIEAPVVLLPTDELVLGLDAGITLFANVSSTITGSFMRIMPEKSQITLYGSHLVNGERKQHSKRLATLGESVSFDVEANVSDEFHLDPLATGFGNYNSIFVSGDPGSRTLQSWVGTIIDSPPGYAPKTPRQYANAFFPGVDYFRYPRITSAVDSLAKPVDSGSISRRFVFRNDRFGNFANLLYVSPDAAARQTSVADGVGFVKKISRQDVYTVTNVFTGSTTLSGNTSLHAEVTDPFFDS